MKLKLGTFASSYSSTLGSTFLAGNIEQSSLKSLMEEMTNTSPVSTPSNGGTLSINSQSMGSYDYVIKGSSTTVSSFNDSDWFTLNEDSHCALICVQGDLTIDSGQIFQPSKRKLFTCIYVDGNLTVNGEISMTGRGANHSTTGSNIAPVDIKLADGTYSGVENPIVPASGGNGGLGGVDPDGSWYASGKGITGGSGSNGGTGGGGGGAHYLPWYSGGSRPRGGDGSAGTSFSGGCGGGSVYSIAGLPNIDASINGGLGGYTYNYWTNFPPSAGAGNPTGNAVRGARSNGGGTVFFPVNNGTGGTLIIFVSGEYSGSGSVTSKGICDDRDNIDADPSTGKGSGSGGGSITIFSSIDNGPIPVASGALGETGDGGLGTARKLIL